LTWSAGRVAVLSVFILLSALPRGVAADSSAPLPPTGLAMSRAGSAQELAAGSWINAGKLDLRFQVQVSNGPVVPQVEVEPVGTAFTGTPNFHGSSLSSSGVADVQVGGLADAHRYHWQARIVDASGAASPWAAYAAPGSPGFDFGVDTDAPARPVITSSSNPVQSKWYHNKIVTLQWQAQDTLSGIKGYAFKVGHRPSMTVPTSTVAASGAHLTNLGNGVWYVLVRAQDNAGNWSTAATYRVQLDRTMPRIRWLSAWRFQFNPYQGATTVRFRVTKNAAITAQLWRVGSHLPTAQFHFPHARAGQTIAIRWNGRTGSGKFVPKGYYYFAFKAVDHAGNVLRTHLGGITVNPAKPTVSIGGITLYPTDGKRIIVVLSQETLYAVQGDRVVVKTYVTTGNRELPTPTGTYHILARYHPYEMISPWPPGSPYYYAPSWMEYAMLFRNGGYFLHDAPWRSVFGPGSNSGTQPGTNYGGTHGCVNIPSGPMTTLWGWAPIGTEVDVVP
jgi:hypothetical protein